MTTAWSALPNAAHVDRILADVKANPKRWSAALDAARGAALDAAWDAARDAALDAARGAALDAAWSAAWDAAWDAAWGALAALVAWDDCAYLLEYTPTQVRSLLAIEPDNHAATLLLPAVIALHGDT